MSDTIVMSMEILKAVPGTLLYSLIILIISLLIGAAIEMAVPESRTWLRLPIDIVTSFIKGNPLVVLLFFCYYTFPDLVYNVLSDIGVHWDKNNISPAIVIVISFSIYYAAYQRETVRSAISSVNISQKELAQSLGYTTIQTYTRIIFPQAIYYALPNIINTFLRIITSMALGFMITVVDIFAQAKISAALNSEYVLAFSIAALIYWGISILVDKLLRLFEQKRKFN